MNDEITETRKKVQQVLVDYRAGEQTEERKQIARQLIKCHLEILFGKYFYEL